MTDWKSRLTAIREANNDAAWAMAEYIDQNPCAITASLLREIDPDGRFPEEKLYAACMAGICGISEQDRDTNGYFEECVRCLSPSDLSANPYLKTIRFPDTAHGGWRFTHYAYRPYEAFIRDDIRIDPNMREIPQTGYFRERFVYPAVEQDGREWMAVKPSEIATMQPALDIISGNVAVFGLGLGYFAFMASENPAVKNIDIIEISSESIELFEKHVLPQFPHKEKIRSIICSDAFEFMEKGLPGDYDFVFIDLWHDTSDGLEMYIRARKSEKPGPEYLYWVEKSLLSAYRWTRFEDIVATSDSEEEALERLGDNALRRELDPPHLH